MTRPALQRHLVAVTDRYRALTLRERVMVSVSVLTVTWFLWSATLGGYLEASRTRMDQQVAAANQSVRAGLAERSRLDAAEASDPDAPLLEERNRLDAQLVQMRNSLGSLLDRFVEPERMPALLEDVIRHHGGLTLKRIESLPAEPVDVSSPAKDGEQQAPVWIYRHPLRLELEGGYFDVMAYLSELEQGPWVFGWRTLSYEVADYPMARVTLEIETLSRDRSWIGV